MSFDFLLPALVAGTGLVALGVGLVTLNSVVTMRDFITEEIDRALVAVVARVESNSADIEVLQNSKGAKTNDVQKLLN